MEIPVAGSTPSREGEGHSRTGLSVPILKRAFLDNLFYVLGRSMDSATLNDMYQAAAFTLRDRILQRMHSTARSYKAARARTVCYFSAEYLLGPHLANNVLNLGIEPEVIQLGNELGIALQDLVDEEEEPGLGNGGLGRLAACYMESMATLQIPCIGYGIRYEFGIFDQEFRDGWQVEKTDNWLHAGNPWELCREKLTFPVPLGGRTERFTDDQGRERVRWIPDRVVNGVAYDTPILGYQVDTANLLRLWKAEAPESFDFQAFNVGDYYRAVDRKVSSENLTKVLYPNDEPEAGKQLRLEQQYFFCACSLRDMLRIHQAVGDDLRRFHERWVVQLNDTHPAIAVPELMRLLVDEHDVAWNDAWEITRRTFCYTNHTLLPEALETWPVSLLARLLPRHMEIIYEINAQFLREVRLKYPGDEGRVRALSIIDEADGRSVRMAHLACVGSQRINGVAELHTRLLRSTVLRSFHELWPDKIVNVTNGVTPRRFMALSNPSLRIVISRRLGTQEWITRPERLRELEAFADDPGLHEEWRHSRQLNKAHLAGYIQRYTGSTIDPETLFDIQVKRIHEYKRQQLNLLHIVSLYLRLRNDSSFDPVPRTFIFGGKGAPGYAMAKLIIKLINSVASVINTDPLTSDRLRVVFFPNYNVKNSHYFFPAADVSEQISTAGKEASGTGNMKFSLNGALTVGTLDGANVEIREAVGAENFFLFGLNAEEVQQHKAAGYRPREILEGNDLLADAVRLIESGFFSEGDTELFRPLLDSMMNRDPYMVFADFQAYADCQAAVGDAFAEHQRWTRMSILNTARMGRFSSDRSIQEYARGIWHVQPVPVTLDQSIDYLPPPEARARAEKLNRQIRG